MKRNNVITMFPAALLAAVTMSLLSMPRASGRQRDLVLGSYNGTDTEIAATRSITLRPGFHIPAGRNVGILIRRDAGQEDMPSTLPASQNYILKSTLLKPYTSIGHALKAADKMQDVEYYDGLGRPVQSVQVKGSPSFGDIVSHRSYDAFGREDRSYLPYTGGENGQYKSNAIAAQAAFYNSGSSHGVVNIPVSGGTTPSFGRPEYEASPLGRVLRQGFPGAAWQPVARGTSTGRTVDHVYTSNSNGSAFTDVANTRRVARYRVNYASGGTPELVLEGIYANNQLYITVTRDENWRSGRAGNVWELTDKQGRTVLKRVFNTTPAGALEMLSTYYVYDDMGRLCFVLTPGAEGDRASLPAAGTARSTWLDSHAYRYRYDGRGRMSHRKLPGKAWENMVYNGQDLVVMHQDGRKLDDGTFYHTFYKYDGLGRMIMKGTEGNRTLSQEHAQQAVDAQQAGNHWEQRAATGGLHGYTNRSIPQDGGQSDVMEVNYYDSYGGIPSLPGSTAPSGYSGQVHGLLTAKKVRVIGTGTWLWTVYYYDNLGRVKREWSQHYRGSTVSGNRNIMDYTYNFAGQPTQSVQALYTNNALAVTVTTKYSYDHRGRLVDTHKQVRNGTASPQADVLLSRREYNEIGQLASKGLHGRSNGTFAEKVNYAYNARGWLREATSGRFSQTLRYSDAPSGVTPQFNGNISRQEWSREGSVPTGYSYVYDAMDRLTAGTADGGQSELLSYDRMGNILTLGRDGASPWNYSYSGNRLSNIKFGSTTYTYAHEPESGNMTRDGRNGADISYNYLNLPQSVTGGRTLNYVYDGNGEKLHSRNAGVARAYAKGTEWVSSGLELVHTEEGRLVKSGDGFIYEYVLGDHLGNARSGFRVNGSGSAETNLSRDYYPFGMAHGTGAVTPSPKNNYLYNGKELQDGLGTYDYGARFYDPVIGRWGSVDPLAEFFYDNTVYNYALNNPIRFTDPDGMAAADTVTRNGGDLPTAIINGTKNSTTLPIGLPFPAPNLPALKPIPPPPNPIFVFLGLLLLPMNYSDQPNAERQWELENLNRPYSLNAKKHEVGDKLPTPESDPDKFVKKRGNQGYENKDTGEIYQKSHTSHRNQNNEGTQWKVWPKGTTDFGPNSKRSGQRTTLDQNGTVIGN